MALYDTLSNDYDRFVNWEARLTYELPFYERLFGKHGTRRVLDAACGTGMHAIALARRGYRVTGADLSAPMIERARENAAILRQDFGELSRAAQDPAAEMEARFVVAGFGEMAKKVGTQFDAVLCLGNSLPHVLSAGELSKTLADFAAVLRPGGLLLIQNRNFDAVMARRERWMEPQAHREGRKACPEPRRREWLFVRFYDFNPDGTLTFNVLTLHRDDGGEWKQQAEATRLRPWLHAELQEMVAAAGFGAVACYGNMTGEPFNPETSGNLIITALREKIL